MRLLNCKYIIILCLLNFCFGISEAYVGSERCGECHEDIYNRFIEKSIKSSTLKRVKMMEKKLTVKEFQECFKCHTTGYGSPGGFVSETETPALAHVGCESCHGEGDTHADSEDPDDIVSAPPLDVCAACHSQSEDKVFKKNALMYSGAH